MAKDEPKVVVSRKSLIESITDYQKQIVSIHTRMDEATLERNQAIKERDEARAKSRALSDEIGAVRAQFDDLKTRLITSENENQRMRGYIARVQEDDVVREELVPTGDPAGEMSLVPKRKSAQFYEPQPMSNTGNVDDRFSPSYHGGEPRRKAKHWITY